jgi:hypothetical protein
MELRMRHSPSIIPTDRLDRDIYLVLEDFRAGAAWRETDESDTDVSTVVEDLLTGQYEQPLRVVAFNAAEGWSRDATEEIAEELDRRIAAEGRGVSETLQAFVEGTSAARSAISWRCHCASEISAKRSPPPRLEYRCRNRRERSVGECVNQPVTVVAISGPGQPAPLILGRGRATAAACGSS